MYLKSFAPVVGASAHTLILGSMPGVESLRQQQYYAHPRNAFWPIMQSLYGVDLGLAYQQRCSQLRLAGVAVWDVLAQCQRKGSADAAIDMASVEVNDIKGLLEQCPGICRIGLNGGAAAKLFKKHCQANIDLPALVLPSSSPAYAAMSQYQKQQRWAELLLPASAA